MFGGSSLEQGELERQDGDGEERESKRAKQDAPLHAQAAEAQASAGTASNFRISVVTMAGAAIAIEDAAAANTILSVKHRVFAANRKLYVRRQRLVYRPGPRGMDALPDDETLGGAGVAQDGSAELDVLLVDATDVEMVELGHGVRRCRIPNY
jgi:hypothetical protein